MTILSGRWQKYILPLIILGLLGLFVINPIVSVLTESLKDNGDWSLGNYREVFDEPHLSNIIWDSLKVSIGVALVSTLMGLIMSLIVVRTRLPLRRFFATLTVFPMIIPGFVTTLAYIFLFGRNGLITYQWLDITWDVYSWKSVFILQCSGLTTTAFLLITAVMVTLDSRVEDSARSLGASEWKVLTTVTLPLLRPGLIAALLLTFMASISDFGTPMIVGGKFDTLASASYTQLIGRYNMPMAATQNVILLIITITAFWLYTKGQAMNIGVRSQGEGGERKPLDLGRPLNTLLWSVAAIFCLGIVMLAISVFLSAFTKHIGANYDFTLEHFDALPQRAWGATKNTLFFASVTAVVVGILGIIIAYLIDRVEFKGRRFLDWLTTLPFAIPGTFMGLGFALAFNREPLLWSGTWMIIVACTVIRELPMGLRAGVSVLTGQDRSLEDASTSLGAGRITTFIKVILPMSRPAILVAALYAFVSTVQTLGAIIFLITPGTRLLSVDVFEATLRNNVGEAAALSTIMIGLSAAGVIAIYAITQRQLMQTWFRKITARGSRL